MLFYFGKTIRKQSEVYHRRKLGLLALNGVGYGTPFVTKADAITEGKRLNILNGETGITYNDDNDLTNVLLNIHKRPQKYINMGSNVREYYLKYRTLEKMIDSIVN